MDSRDIKIILNVATVFFAGGAVGAVAGWVVGSDKARKKAWVETEVQLEEMEDRLKRLYKIGEYSAPYVSAELLAVKPGEATEFPIGITGSQEELEAALENLKTVVENEEYKSISIETPDLFDSYTNEDLNITPNMDDPEPYIISEEEFQHDQEDYTKISLEFYPGDRVVTDDQERVVEDVETTIGVQSLNYFSPENTVVYVRNNRLEADFEISLQIGSYRETVLGEEAPVMERPRRKTRPKDE